jgi:hypothetical protein
MVRERCPGKGVDAPDVPTVKDFIRFSAAASRGKVVELPTVDSVNAFAGWFFAGSIIVRTVARKYNDQKRLGASFFFSRGGGDVGHAGKFCTTIAVQLANNVPTPYWHICERFRWSDTEENSFSIRLLRCGP